MEEVSQAKISKLSPNIWMHFTIMLSITIFLEEPNHKLAEQLDQDITRATQHAENQCRRLRRDYWSIPLHTIRRELSIWNSFKCRRKKKLDNTALYKKASEIGITISDDTLV